MATAGERIKLEHGGALLADTQIVGDIAEVSLALEGVNEPVTLHWGVGRGSRRWQLQLGSEWPEATRPAEGGTLDTAFPDGAGPRRLTVKLHPSNGDTSLDFVLFFPASGRWDNNRGLDYRVPVPAAARRDRSGSADAVIEDLAGRIVERETGNHSWTLMHRFDLCHELLDRVEPPPSISAPYDSASAGLALLFVWLRFSAIRQLDWQRNYNTKPRELAHAQDRLTLKLAHRFAHQRGERPWLRLMFTTVGRGGEGQRVRDEVLNIMHRHHIKEVSGHFMEEWHQKLHNNTTPDDVVICEAYLAFLRSNGDRATFYRTLEGGGVTRARLESYERPIRSEPDFIPHLKDALLHDFEDFLRVLNRLHSGTDLDAAVDGAGPLVGGDLGGALDWIRQHRHEGAAPLEMLVARITDARRMTAARLGSLGDASDVRALVYLDIALEDLARLAIERQLQQPRSVGDLSALITSALENVRLSIDDAELRQCGTEWEQVRTAPRGEPSWVLRADATLDRTGRAVATLLDRAQRVLQPLAERLGRGFHADQWTIAGFSEEVMRGRPIVVLPVLARLLRQGLREQGGLAAWQVVSRGRGSGYVHVVKSLDSIQGLDMTRPTIVLAETVGGQEEIPAGVTAVVTSREVDVLSHLAIRARNAGVLLASCLDGRQIERLRAFEGRPLTLTVGASGDGLLQEGASDDASPRRGHGSLRLAVPAEWAGYGVGEDRFDEGTVGRKALGLRRLHGRLPSWIHLPRSVAVPFGGMEQALADPLNAEARRHYAEATGHLRRAGDAATRRRVLEDMRHLVSALAMPEPFEPALRHAMEQGGLAWPGADRAWQCVRRVWASKWNERAFLSREANGFDHAAVAMSVLIQKVVEADYAFVIHTTNPFTGAYDELYAEVVLGLGETLVGNYPGRALSFTWNKASGSVAVRTLPSKSIGLFGGGLIFRSDSNAEDLTGYAGAGLYDSVLLEPPREVLLDYAREPIVWDARYQRDVASKIAHIGMTAEQAAGAPQDVEGACSNGEWYLLQSRPQVRGR
jgi:alpha-glucan,water dikinase